MNSTSEGLWCNPPPPGIDEDISNNSSIKNEQQITPERIIDRIDPFLKSNEYLRYERKLSSERSKRRSRSKSRHRRRRSRSRSRGRHKHRRRRYSSSRSRSRSRSRRHKRNRHSKSRSRSRSKSHKSHKTRHRRSRSRRRSENDVKVEQQVDEKKQSVEEEVEEEEEEEPPKENAFKNDGTFMEMFKKMQEEQQQKSEMAKPTTSAETKMPPLPAFGKRRGGKVLKTGLVQKIKTKEQEEAEAQDAWTLYMKEVKRYKEACCDDDSKTRLLVK